MSTQPNPAQLYEDFLVTHQFRPFARDLVVRAAPQPGEKVLDLACGTGVVARLVAPHVLPTGSATGLDINPGMLAVGQDCARAEGLEIHWQEGNLMALPFDDVSFDLVFCQQGPQFSPEKSQAFREIHRVLAPGGRAVTSSWTAIEQSPVLAAFDRVVHRHFGLSPIAVPYGLSDADEVRRLMGEAGFAAVEITPLTLTIRFPSFSEYARRTTLSLAAALPDFARLPAEEQQTRARAVEADFGAEVGDYIDGEALNSPLWTNIAIVRR